MSAPCPRTAEVEADPFGEHWPEELRSHLPACPRCSETALVVRRLKDLCLEINGSGAPTAGAVFQRARLRRRIEERTEEIERAAWPLRLAEGLAAALLVAASVALIRWGGETRTMVALAILAASPLALLAGVVLAFRR